MNLEQTLAKLESLGNEKTRKHFEKRGAGEKQFGVPLGEVRKLAKAIGRDPDLAHALWGTEIVDARMLAILLITPKTLSRHEVDQWVRSVSFDRVADWLNAYIVKKHAEKESLREEWMHDDDPMAARAGWNLTAERVAKKPDGLDLNSLLGRLETEMGTAAKEAQWTMNFVLAEIGIQEMVRRQG